MRTDRHPWPKLEIRNLKYGIIPMSFNHEEEGRPALCDNMDGP